MPESSQKSRSSAAVCRSLMLSLNGRNIPEHTRFWVPWSFAQHQGDLSTRPYICRKRLFRSWTLIRFASWICSFLMLQFLIESLSYEWESRNFHFDRASFQNFTLSATQKRPVQNNFEASSDRTESILWLLGLLAVNLWMHVLLESLRTLVCWLLTSEYQLINPLDSWTENHSVICWCWTR